MDDKKENHCEALKWQEETIRMCCFSGSVSLPSLDDPKKTLKTLYLYKFKES